MANLIRFKIRKDLTRRIIIFTPIWFNNSTKFTHKCIHVDFINKVVKNEDNWSSCRVNQNYISFCFSGYTNLREKDSSGLYEIFRIYNVESNKDYFFPVRDNEDIDVMYARIIKGLEIISNYITK